MRAIFFQELKLFYKNSLFHIIIGISALLLSLTFLRSISRFSMKASLLESAQSADINPLLNIHFQVFISHISMTHIVLIFLIPALVMRVISEDKKQRSFPLLMISPLSTSQILAGKFLACLAVIASFLFVSLLYPLSTAMVTEFLFSPLLVAYLGVFLISIVYLGLAFFVSTLVDSPYVSLLLSLLLSFLFISVLGQLALVSEDPLYSRIIAGLVPGQHLNVFIKGAFRLSSLVYFLSLGGFLFYLSVRNIEFSRWKGL